MADNPTPPRRDKRKEQTNLLFMLVLVAFAVLLAAITIVKMGRF
jgi:hypothetical protein